MSRISIKKNFIMNALLTMSQFIFPLITFPYVSRILQVTGTGKVSFATSLVSYFAMFAQLGIPTYGIRACAKVRDHKEELTRVTQELLIINLVTMLFAYIAFFGMLLFVPRLQSEKPLYIVVSVTILLNTVGMEWLYKGLEQYSYITIRSIIFKFIALILMLLLIHQKSDYVLYGALSVFASAASNLFNLFHAHRFISLRPVGHYNFRRHMKAIGVFFAMSCATTIYTQLDTVMLGFMATDTDVGYYNAAVRIKTILVSVVTSLGAVLLPRSSYYVQEGNMKEFKRLTAKALNFVWIISLPLTLYFMLFAKEGIYTLAGSGYTGSIAPMQLIMPTLVLIGLSDITGIQILVPIGKEIYVLYSEIAGAVTDLVLNAILIPVIQSSGAAIGTLVAEFVVLMVQVWALRKDHLVHFKDVCYWKLGLAALLAVPACLWTKQLHFVNNLSINSLFIIVISGLLFFGVYFALLTVTKEELTLSLEKQLLQKLRGHRPHQTGPRGNA
ncbi:MAG: flippase [Bilifractor sp.]